jgi:hypothetical protein
MIFIYNCCLRVIILISCYRLRVTAGNLLGYPQVNINTHRCFCGCAGYFLLSSLKKSNKGPNVPPAWKIWRGGKMTRITRKPAKLMQFSLFMSSFCSQKMLSDYPQITRKNGFRPLSCPNPGSIVHDCPCELSSQTEVYSALSCSDH